MYSALHHPRGPARDWGQPFSWALADPLVRIGSMCIVPLVLLMAVAASAGDKAVRATVTDTGASSGDKMASQRVESPVTVRTEPLPSPPAGMSGQGESRTEPTPAVGPREAASSPEEVISVASDNHRDLGIRPIRSLTVDIGLPAAQDNQRLQVPMPVDEASGYFQQFPAAPPGNTAYIPWMLDDSYDPPLNFCYRPLYFEDVNLERYGYSWGIWQPAVSTVKFYANAVLLPYRMITQPPCKCTYHAHLSRPGGPAPRERQVLKGPFARFKN